MYCPSCGAQNIAEARFCRLCGTAFRGLTKGGPALPALPDYGRAFRPLFVGVGFLFIALISVFSHAGFLWWMMFPAISLLLKGVRRLINLAPARACNAFPQSARMLGDDAPQPLRRAGYRDVRARPTGELVPPPSVTENTTRLLEENSPAAK
jgi:hypothetical protein